MVVVVMLLLMSRVDGWMGGRVTEGQADLPRVASSGLEPGAG